MKLTLRDLFWLQILAVVVICWAWEYGQLSPLLKKHKQSSWLFIDDGPQEPSKDALARTATLKELKSLSDEELMKRVAKKSDDRQTIHEHSSDYSCCLTELARRHMHQELQTLYDDHKALNKSEDVFDRPSNAELLTALRRAQGHPDPIAIEFRIPTSNPDDESDTRPAVYANIKNVDELDESIFYFAGGDDRSGRQGGFRVRLVDQKGHTIEDSNFMPSPMGGGIGIHERLKAGEKSNWTYWFDLRSYVKPPPSGLYTLEVIHGNGHIADEPNLDGLIVWTSAPIQVRVENRGPPKFPITAFPLLGISLFAGIILILKSLRTMRQQSAAGASDPTKLHIHRDLIFLSFIVVLILCWLDHSRHMRMDILKHQSDSEADWTIRVVD